MIRPWLSNKWENVRASLWFVPGLLVVACALLAQSTLFLDRKLEAEGSAAIPYLFSGTADAAGTILSALSGSLLTVLSIAFSLTMVALQQASSQFSPRILRSITSSRVNQLVVGVYAGTFIYCLLVLRTIRGEHAPYPFVPGLSVTTAVLLALLCIAMLVYFIHHVSLSLQVSEVIASLHDELLKQFDQLFPEHLAGELEPNDSHELEGTGAGHACVRASRGGFVRRVDHSFVATAAPGATIWLRAQVGDYVPRNGTLAHLWPADDGPLIARVRSAYVMDGERSLAQDPLFGIRQLVDIGLRALSPGVNDPTTAEYVLLQLGDALGVLADRRFPPWAREPSDRQVRLVVAGPDWEVFVKSAFAQLRRSARSDFDVTRCLLRVLAALAESVTSERRARPLRRQVEEVQSATTNEKFSAEDQAELSACIELALHELEPTALASRRLADVNASSPDRRTSRRTALHPESPPNA